VWQSATGSEKMPASPAATLTGQEKEPYLIIYIGDLPAPVSCTTI